MADHQKLAESAALEEENPWPMALPGELSFIQTMAGTFAEQAYYTCTV